MSWRWMIRGPAQGEGGGTRGPHLCASLWRHHCRLPAPSLPLIETRQPACLLHQRPHFRHQVWRHARRRAALHQLRVRDEGGNQKGPLLRHQVCAGMAFPGGGSRSSQGRGEQAGEACGPREGRCCSWQCSCSCRPSPPCVCALPAPHPRAAASSKQLPCSMLRTPQSTARMMALGVYACANTASCKQGTVGVRPVGDAWGRAVGCLGAQSSAS